MPTNLIRAAPFVLLAAALGVGVALARFFDWSIPSLLVCGLVSAVSCIFAARAKNAMWAWLFALCLCVALGASRYAISKPNPANDPLRQQHGRNVAIEGWIADEPDVRQTYVNLRVRPLRDLSQALSFKPDTPLILIRANKETVWKYGDVVRVAGIADAPFFSADFDYRDYLARKNIYTAITRPDSLSVVDTERGNAFWSRLYAFKERLRQSARRVVPAPESAFLNGILIGDDNDIPDTLRNDFRRTGTSHVVAISGFNVSIVIALVLPLLGIFFNKRRVAFIAIPAIVLYTLLVGASPSVVRAAVMAIIALVGNMNWRRGFTLNTLCAAAFIMLLFDPQNMFDGGFQLSFMATLGLVLYSDILESRVRLFLANKLSSVWAQRVAHVLGAVLLVTFAAQVTTLPLILQNFKLFSVVAPLTNALILWLQPFAMVLGGVAALIGLVSDTLGVWFGYLAYAPLTLTLRAVTWTAQFGWASTNVYTFGDLATTSYYLVLFIATLLLTQPIQTKHRLAHLLRTRFGTFAGVAFLMAGAVGLAVWQYQKPDGKLHIVFSGTGAFVQTPRGQQLVFAGSTVLPHMGRAMPLWDKTIEYVILPERNDKAFANALPVLQSYAVQKLFWLNGADEPSTLLREWQTAMSNNVQLSQTLQLSQPFSITLEPALTLVLQPQLGNAMSARLVYNDIVFELVGGAPPIRQSVAQHAVLFVAPNKTNAEFVNAVQPRWVVWADSAARAPNLSASIKTVALRQAGAVAFVTDGKALSVNVSP